MCRLKFWFPLAALMLALSAAAQTAAPKVEARVTPDSIGIGDRFTLSVEVDKDMLQVVEFPYYKDGNFGNGLEILSESLDTLSADGRRVRLRKDYTMAAFEEGIHEIGRFPVLYLDKNITDTLFSSGDLLLEVGTFEIDTATQTIYDIKAPMDAPVRFGEYFGYVMMWLGIAAVAALIVWAVIRYLKGRSVLGWKPRREEPPHVTAMNELVKLQQQKLWQNGKHKLYYTRLTDILRGYIAGRYSVPAMEMTSDEIVSQVAATDGIPVRDREALAALLRTADLVKFAKYTPEAVVNQTSYEDACRFVDDTKPVETATEADEQTGK